MTITSPFGCYVRPSSEAQALERHYNSQSFVSLCQLKAAGTVATACRVRVSSMLCKHACHGMRIGVQDTINVPIQLLTLVYYYDNDNKAWTSADGGMSRIDVFQNKVTSFSRIVAFSTINMKVCTLCVFVVFVFHF